MAMSGPGVMMIRIATAMKAGGLMSAKSTGPQAALDLRLGSLSVRTEIQVDADSTLVTA